ncbi:hypothetical protein AYL99_02228 [Fonsecaea erecta]|uniref:Uncharacterized protein n=1 Tax=Fonsecaea erecta TaxID=1367422 RepID=A0A178ZU86_9EURO|nr:hypothetical protein AYL99_02228 [Fonsecaea erecta]OAP63001.1 hypothetical protein AYL99_02228 [Fonsecaea erecta]
MALNVNIRSRSYSQRPATVNNFVTSPENCAGAVTQPLTRSASEIHYPAPTRNHHAQEVSIRSSPLQLERECDGGTITRLWSFVSAKFLQWCWTAPELILKRYLARCLRFVSSDTGTIEGYGGAGGGAKRFREAACQNMDTNGHVIAYRPQSSGNFGPDLKSRGWRLTDRHEQPGSRTEESEDPKSAAAAFPVQAQDKAGIDPAVLAYRGILLMVRKADGEVDSFVATQDPGSDASVMTLAFASSLGYEPCERQRGTPLICLEQLLVLSLGTVRIPFWLPCNRNERWVEFHLVHDLLGHKALLGVRLTMDLGHLQRLPCACDDSVVDCASP